MSALVSSLVIVHIVSILYLANADQYNVVNYGAKGDGKTDSTTAFLSAWKEACGSIKPATVYAPSGSFLLKKVEFNGPCKNNNILVRIDGMLVAPSDYNVLAKAENWLAFLHVDGVMVSGGVLDAKGQALWACKASGKNCPYGATSLLFSNSTNIVVSGLTSLNSQIFHVVFNGCNNVHVNGVTISASGQSPNTDGIHVQLSTGVTILNSKIRTGDDCISIGPGTTNLWIQNITCGPGHGISIGSLGKDAEEQGVQNVTVKSVIFTGTQNGVRIKSWGRPSSGFVKEIRFQNAVMNNVQNPIIIDQNYCPGDQNCPGQDSSVRIMDVTYEDIKGTSATQVAVKFDCSEKKPCSKIKLKDVKLTYKNETAEASCKNADGTASGLVEPTSCL
ncbi:Pectin lyase-like superfamily protein [Euphorbia peplus]|nr:Pectin lyase-like superfamily protein [Euphorbia peplus]